MARIKIEWLSDTDDSCELCGFTSAEGAVVSIDGKKAIDMTPVAYCRGGEHYEASEVFEAILKHLGHTLENA